MKNKHVFESDMASTAKALSEFSEKDGEGINIWLKEYEIICIATSSNERQQARLLITKSKDARTQYSERIEASKWQANISNLKADLKTRFHAQSKLVIKLTPFLNRPNWAQENSIRLC